MAESEINLERKMGQPGIEDNSRPIISIDMSNFDQRKQEIKKQLWEAATETGFFYLINHGISQDDVDQMFALSAQYFGQTQDKKMENQLVRELNSGYEFKAQVRPSSGLPDQKESFQISLINMSPELWPQDIPEFQSMATSFMKQCDEVALKVLMCFAEALGFPSDYFAQRHDSTKNDCQNTLRLLHYPPLENESHEPNYWRAAPHTDFDSVTLLFQKLGEAGLQVCPGKEADTHRWTPVDPVPGAITVNIGDMLMRWSDDKLKSNFHRVRMPRDQEYKGARYSIAYFTQANKNAIIEGPQKKYPPITAYDYLQQRIKANYARNGT